MSDQYACDVAELQPGTALQVDLTIADGSDIPVAIVRAEDGQFHAIDAMCTHGEVPLAEGDVEGSLIECWAHGSRFNLLTGMPEELPAIEPVSVYPVRIDGERVLVDVDHPKTS